MPTISSNQTPCEEIQDIITSIPSWIIRWGVSLVFVVLASILFLASIIQYPDIIATDMSINSLNAPKVVLARQSGKLEKLLVEEGTLVVQGQHLAFLESTAKPEDIFILIKELKILQSEIIRNKITNTEVSYKLQLGEIQGNFQDFYLQLMQYQSTLNNGYYLGKLAILEKELSDLKKMRYQIEQRGKIQLEEYANYEDEYRSYQKLYKSKVISRNEFRLQENKFLASKYPLQQNQTDLIINSNAFTVKQREIYEVQHTVDEGRSKFLQSVNQCLTEAQRWIQDHVLIAPVDGKVTFAGSIQQNQNITAGQEIFIINGGNKTFFGELRIPQYNMGKIKLGEKVLVRMESYPSEQFGVLEGRLTFLSDVAYRDSIFPARVSFDNTLHNPSNIKIIMKNGMRGRAEIITEESTLLKRFLRNLTKMLNRHN